MSSQIGELTEAIYDAVLDPAGWDRVMTGMRKQFSSRAEPFYILDLEQHVVRPVYSGGIGRRFVANFNDCYFTPDNPWLAADALHRPGMVRTDRSLYAFHRDETVLRRSAYYDTWLRPQGLEHSLGTTLLDEDGLRANITLLRGPDAGPYARREIAGFRVLAGHLKRGLRIARRLELLRSREAASFATLDRLTHAVMMLDAGGTLVHANAPAEALLRAGDGLRLRDRTVVTADHRHAAALATLLREARQVSAGGDSLMLRRAGGGRLLLSAMPLPADREVLVARPATVLLLIVDPDAIAPGDIETARRLYRLTAAEARLARLLLDGLNLRQAADAAGITYETARWYLKALFQKTDTNRQAELVARLLRDIAATPLV